MKPGTRVLVIEDDRSIAQLSELELEEYDLEVRCCYDGISGLGAVTEFGPAVVVLDIMLPGMDGVGVLKRIRQRGNRRARTRRAIRRRTRDRRPLRPASDPQVVWRDMQQPS